MFNYKKNRKRSKKKGVRLFTETLYTSSIESKKILKKNKLTQIEYNNLCDSVALVEDKISIINVC